jgi:anti-anti-sigma factor
VGDAKHPAGLVVVRMPAELDATNAERVGEELAAGFAPGVWAVIADMTGTTFCDSPAVAMLVRTHLRAAEKDAELRLATHSRAVLRALAIALVDYSLRGLPQPCGGTHTPVHAGSVSASMTRSATRRAARRPGPVSGMHQTRAGARLLNAAQCGP